MDIYDVSDCARPRLLTTFTFPENIHNLTISPDGNRVYATLPLQVVDIRDPAHPVFLGNLEKDIPQPNIFQQAGLPVNYLAHEVLTSPDGNILYLGGQTPLSRLVHDRRHHRLAGSHAEGAEPGQGARPLRPPGDDQRPEVRAPLRGEHRRADREGMRAGGAEPVRRARRSRG